MSAWRHKGGVGECRDFAHKGGDRGRFLNAGMWEEGTWQSAFAYLMRDRILERIDD
jgi:hypothetical protein